MRKWFANNLGRKKLEILNQLENNQNLQFLCLAFFKVLSKALESNVEFICKENGTTIYNNTLKMNDHMSASIVKQTISYPCLVFNASDSKLYTNFEFFEEKNHRNLQEKCTYFKRWCNGVQVDDIEQETI